MIPECWTDTSQNCAIVQLSAHLELDVEEHSDEIRPDWRQAGLLAQDIIALGKRLHRSTYVLGENRLLLKHEVATKEKSICCMVALGHFHLYKSARWALKMTPCADERVMQHKRLLVDHPPASVDVESWRPWTERFQPGEFVYTGLL